MSAGIEPAPDGRMDLGHPFRRIARLGAADAPPAEAGRHGVWLILDPDAVGPDRLQTPAGALLHAAAGTLTDIAAVPQVVDAVAAAVEHGATLEAWLSPRDDATIAGADADRLAALQPPWTAAFAR